jgi:uncharacterized membrane protein
MSARRAHGPRRAPAPIVPDRPIAIVAGVALVISLYLTITKFFAAGALFCERGGGCDIVQSSRWAMFFGVPTAGWGVLVYAGIGALALAGFTARRWLGAFLLAVIAAAFSGYLTWIELVVLRAICPYCIVVALAAVALLVLLIVRRPHAVMRRSWGAPVRLAALAVVTAVVVIVFGAAAFKVDTTFMASSAQEGLARHLASTGAVFYGAFW